MEVKLDISRRTLLEAVLQMCEADMSDELCAESYIEDLRKLKKEVESVLYYQA